MARAQRQKRWRANTGRKRIELYLSLAAVEQLDALAAARGVSRAVIVDDLITEAESTAKNLATADAVPKTEEKTQSIQTALEVESPVAPEPSAATADNYKCRRPRSDDERRYKWIADIDDGTRIALGADPARFHRWRGIILVESLYIRDAKGNSRDAVISKLLARR